MDKVDILLVIPPFHMRNGGGHFFPMGTGYIVSSLASRHHTYHIINCTDIVSSLFEEDLETLRSEVTKQIKEYQPLVIGIGPCVTTQLKALKVIADVCKNVFPDTPFFAGGPFASISGQEEVFFNRIGIAYLIQGDGEEAVPNLLDVIKRGGSIKECSNVSYRGHLTKNIIKDIESIKFPYRTFEAEESFSKRRKKGPRQAAMIASRGCPYNCNYCVSGNLRKEFGQFRKRSFDSIVGEMIFLRDKYNVASVVFYDDLFFPNIHNINSDIDEFCSLLINQRVNMTWQIEMRPDYFVAISDESIERLAKAGCCQINLGIEKSSESGLRFLGKVGNRDGLQEKMKSAKEMSIDLSATFILGGDAETKEDVLALIGYAKSLPLDFAHFNPLFIYPGTPLYYAVFSTEDEWVDRVLQDSLPWGEIVYENDSLKTSDLLELVDLAYSSFYKGTKYERDNMIEDRFNLKR